MTVGRSASVSHKCATSARQRRNRVRLTLKHGEREQTEYAANGMDVTVGRVVRDRNGKVIHRDSFFTQYQLWNGRIEVGR